VPISIAPLSVFILEEIRAMTALDLARPLD
jgi:hypothetical protein